MENCSLNNKLSLLSIINTSILTKSHEHPLLYCFTIDRAKPENSWNCNKCNSAYTYNIPSFYCIFCDFDLCEKCVLKNHLFEIVLYDYNMNLLKNTMNNPNQLYDWQSVFPCHNHLLTLIKKVNNYFFWFCNLCKNKYENNSAFYYCSLCNFHLCQNCVIQWKNNILSNSGNNMNSNYQLASQQLNNNINNSMQNSWSFSQNNNNNTDKEENPTYFSGEQLRKQNNNK